MDFHAEQRDQIVSRLAIDLSNALSFEGLHHHLYLPNEINDGVAMLSDSEQPFEVAKFEYLVPKKWDVTISHQNEDGSKPFIMLRVFKNGDFAILKWLNIQDVMESASVVKRNVS